MLAQKQLALAGKISHFRCNWELIRRDAWVLNAIRGYKLNLVFTPYQLTFARDEIETLETEINNMTLKGAICTADKSRQG